MNERINGDDNHRSSEQISRNSNSNINNNRNNEDNDDDLAVQEIVEEELLEMNNENANAVSNMDDGNNDNMDVDDDNSSHPRYNSSSDGNMSHEDMEDDNSMIQALLDGIREEGGITVDEDGNSVTIEEEISSDRRRNLVIYFPSLQQRASIQLPPARRRRRRTDSQDSDDLMSSSSNLEEESSSSTNNHQIHDESNDTVSNSNTTTTNNNNNNNSNENFESSTMETLPLPRDHSYLPGVSHALFVPNQNHSQTTTQNNKSNDSMDMIINELAILELDGVFLFPGGTLPLRLKNPKWIRYLGSKINQVRENYGTTSSSSQNVKNKDDLDNIVRIGIITKLKHPAFHSNNHTTTTVSPSNTNNNQRRRIQRENSDGNNNVTGTSNSNSRNNTSLDHNQSSTNNINSNSSSNGRTSRRWRTELMRRGSPPRQRRQEQQQSSSNVIQSIIKKKDPLVGRIGTFATITYTHHDSSSSNDNIINSYPSQLVFKAFGTGRFEILSRIDNERDDYSRINNNYVPPPQVGAMADIKLYTVRELRDNDMDPPPYLYTPGRRMRINRGKTKFSKRMIKKISTSTQSSSKMEKSDIIKTENNNSNENNGVLEETKIEAENDNGAVRNGCDDEYYLSLFQHLSSITPLPFSAFKMNWPWRLVDQIRSEVSNNPLMNGVQLSLPATDNDSPLAFSFWMAANMPSLSEHDRMELLTMNCTVQRLRFILDKCKVLTKEQNKKPIRCKSCGEPIAKMTSLFTVGGAEGTTGAYVNEHGHIHQTITIRRILSYSLVYFDEPETRDSWFPGYSWTIAYCHICQSHLGWKFQRVSNNVVTDHNSNDDNRPGIFWGLSGVQVTTDRPSPRRVTRGQFPIHWQTRVVAQEQPNNN